MPHIQRDAFRYRKCQNEHIFVQFDGNRSTESKIQDISSTGMCLETSPDFCETMSSHRAGESCRILFNINNRLHLDRDAMITRCEKQGRWVGLRFKEKLNQFDLNLIRGREACSYELCKIDKNNVMSEAQQIKTCSSNYFIWTVGLLVPLISAVWTLVLQDKIDATACSGAMLAIFLVFCMSVFSNLEKTRAIYKREAFVAAVDTYLITGEAPANYRGWVNLKHNFSECASKRSAGSCPKGIDKNSKNSCKFVGERNAKINEFKKVVPSILDSFISLTAVFYNTLYIIIIILSAISIIRMFSSGIYNLPTERILLHFLIGFICGFFIIGRNTKVLVSICAFTIVAFTIGAINPSVHLPVGIFVVENIYIVLVTFAFGFIVGSVWNMLIAQLINLRKRQYSYESQFFMWLEMLEKCVLLPDYDVKNNHEKNSITKLFDNLIDFIFFGKIEKIWSS